MKNLLPVLNNLLDEKPKKITKEEQERSYKRWNRDWKNFVGKVASVNPENLLGLHHNEIVARYLHTLPMKYRDFSHLYSYLSICIITKDGVFADPLYSGRHLYWRRSFYYFDENGILQVHRKPKRWRPKPLPKAQRMKEFYEKKQAAKKSWKEFRKQKEALHSELLSKVEQKRKEREQQLNLQKIISHGFDPITSFRHDRQ